MRRISKDAVQAFLIGKRFNRDNTSVIVAGNMSSLLLHGNVIATKDMQTGKIQATLCGWPTVTTRERLNAICQSLGMCSMFSQRHHDQYYGDTRISSDEWVIIIDDNQSGDEIAAILGKLANQYAGATTQYIKSIRTLIRDSNGNRVGSSHAIRLRKKKTTRKA